MNKLEINRYLECSEVVDTLTYKGYSDITIQEEFAEAIGNIEGDLLRDALWNYYNKRDSELLKLVGIRVATQVLSSFVTCKLQMFPSALQRFLEDGSEPKETLVAKYTDHS